jgi:hypothetical protein
MRTIVRRRDEDVSLRMLMRRRRDDDAFGESHAHVQRTPRRHLVVRRCCNVTSYERSIEPESSFRIQMSNKRSYRHLRDSLASPTQRPAFSQQFNQSIDSIRRFGSARYLHAGSRCRSPPSCRDACAAAPATVRARGSSSFGKRNRKTPNTDQTLDIWANDDETERQRRIRRAWQQRR